MKMTQLLCAALLSVAALASCRSDEPKQTDEFACICGEADAGFFGCLHPLCADGKTNPDNSECACGPLIEEEE